MIGTSPSVLLAHMNSALIISLLVVFAGYAFAAEPTNADEAAKKKAAQNKAIDEKYQVWKAKLPPDQQGWETV